MEEKQILTSDTGAVEDMTPDYLDAIKNLKQNSVDRQKYEDLKAENKKLLDSIVNGVSVEAKEEKPKRAIEDIRKEWLDENNTNLQYIEKTLELREALIAEGNPDPFLPIGKQILPDDADIAAANRVADVLKDCVEYAQGDSAVFTNELQRRLVDIKIR